MPTHRFRGVIYRGLKSEFSFSGQPTTRAHRLEVTKTAASLISKRLIELESPMCTDHDSIPVGAVKNVYINAEGDWVVDFEIDDSTLAGFDTVGYIQLGIMGELSLRHNRRYDFPSEISVTKKGARDGTTITHALVPGSKTGEYNPVPLDVYVNQHRSNTATVAAFEAKDRDSWTDTVRASDEKLSAMQFDDNDDQDADAEFKRYPGFEQVEGGDVPAEMDTTPDESLSPPDGEQQEAGDDAAAVEEEEAASEEAQPVADGEEEGDAAAAAAADEPKEEKKKTQSPPVAAAKAKAKAKEQPKKQQQPVKTPAPKAAAAAAKAPAKKPAAPSAKPAAAAAPKKPAAASAAAASAAAAQPKKPALTPAKKKTPGVASAAGASKSAGTAAPGKKQQQQKPAGTGSAPPAAQRRATQQQQQGAPKSAPPPASSSSAQSHRTPKPWEKRKSEQRPSAPASAAADEPEADGEEEGEGETKHPAAAPHRSQHKQQRRQQQQQHPEEDGDLGDIDMDGAAGAGAEAAAASEGAAEPGSSAPMDEEGDGDEDAFSSALEAVTNRNVLSKLQQGALVDGAVGMQQQIQQLTSELEDARRDLGKHKAASRDHREQFKRLWVPHIAKAGNFDAARKARMEKEIDAGLMDSVIEKYGQDMINASTRSEAVEKTVQSLKKGQTSTLKKKLDFFKKMRKGGSGAGAASGDQYENNDHESEAEAEGDSDGDYDMKASKRESGENKRSSHSSRSGDKSGSAKGKGNSSSSSAKGGKEAKGESKRRPIYEPHDEDEEDEGDVPPPSFHLKGNRNQDGGGSGKAHGGERRPWKKNEGKPLTGRKSARKEDHRDRVHHEHGKRYPGRKEQQQQRRGRDSAEEGGDGEERESKGGTGMGLGGERKHQSKRSGGKDPVFTYDPRKPPKFSGGRSSTKAWDDASTDDDDDVAASRGNHDDEWDGVSKETLAIIGHNDESIGFQVRATDWYPKYARRAQEARRPKRVGTPLDRAEEEERSAADSVPVYSGGGFKRRAR